MSRQLKSIKLYPVGENRVVISADQQGYVAENGVDKVFVRHPTAYALTKDSINGNIKPNVGIINSVGGQDPLTVSTSGFIGNVDGYDGLLVSSDGYAQARGVIKSNYNTEINIQNPAYLSLDSGFWILGGFDETTGSYSGGIWYSTNQYNFELVQSNDFLKKMGATAFSDGTSVWFAGGWNSDGYSEDIWKGAIQSDGTVVWEGSASTSSLLDDFSTGVYSQNLERFFNGDGYVQIDTGASSPFNYGVDGYDSAIHWDELRSTLWHSVDGYRDEYVFDTSGDLLYDIKHDSDAGWFCHEQSSADTTWTINYGADLISGSYDTVIAIFRGDNNESIYPATSSDDGETLVVTWSRAKTGRAFLRPATSFGPTTSLVVSGRVQDDAWYITKDDLSLLTQASVSGVTSSQFTLNFNRAVSGKVVVIEKHHDTAIGRSYHNTSTSVVAGENTITTNQNTGNSVAWFRDSDNNLVISGGYDNTLVDNTFTFTRAQTLTMSSFDTRHSGIIDFGEPWGATDYTKTGFNYSNYQEVYLSSDGELYVSENAGLSWDLKNDGSLVDIDTMSSLFVNGSSISTFNSDNQIQRSFNQGVDFGDPLPQNTQSIGFYGRLFPEGTDVDTDYNIFIYKRPCDVVWQKSYGYIPENIIDDYETHYVLPYRTKLSNTGVDSVSFVNDLDYARDIVENEFAGFYSYVWDISSDTKYKFKINANSSGSGGDTITLYFNSNLPITFDTNDLVQIIFPRPNEQIYASVLTENITEFNFLWRDTDGSAFDLDVERDNNWVFDYDIKTNLPAFIEESGDNIDKKNLLLSELNRLNALSNLHFNDPYKLTEEQLGSYVKSMGFDINTQNIDLQSLRRLSYEFFEQIDAYGACLDGIRNIADLVGIKPFTATNSAPLNSIVGNSLVLGISQFGEHSFTWESANAIKWDSSESNYYLPASTSIIGADVGSLTNSYIIHCNKGIVYNPILIEDHTITSSIARLYNSDIYKQALNTDSLIFILSEVNTRKLYTFLKLISDFIPQWVDINYE